MDIQTVISGNPAHHWARLAWRIAADACTLNVLALGLLIMTNPMRPPVVLVLLITAGILDWVDGALARRSGGPSFHGAVLDVLADATTFGLAPVTFVAAHTSLAGTPLWAGATIYMTAVIGRLVRSGRFYKQKPTGFIGMPMPATGNLLASLALVLPGVAILPAMIALSALAISRQGYPTLAWLWRNKRLQVLPFSLGVAGLAFINYPTAMVVALFGYVLSGFLFHPSI